MNPIIYIYSKFTQEFLLLNAAIAFALLSIYFYHWVIQRRRMGIARSQVPSAVVQSYLNQLINETEFVRKQLFGLTDGTMPTTEIGTNNAPTAQAISPDLLMKVNTLEAQLKEKESAVVNFNVEKIKLQEEIEKLKSNPSPTTTVNTGNQDQLTQKIKSLEARLEEYSLFEEDLANLKRLQQENSQLKKKMEELNKNPGFSTSETPTLKSVPNPEPEPSIDIPVAKKAMTLDSEAVEKLLDGKPAVDVNSTVQAADSKPEETNIIAAAPATPTTPSDQFENLVDSVESSLVASTTIEAAAPQAEETSKLADKTDEELLKEFENLLNS